MLRSLVDLVQYEYHLFREFPVVDPHIIDPSRKVLPPHLKLTADVQRF